MGDFTGYKDMYGKPICVGDKAKIGEFLFEIGKNPFNGLYTVDGDTGQDFLANVYKQVRLIPTEIDVHEMCNRIATLREKFMHTSLRDPNRAYIGANLIEAAREQMRSQFSFPGGWYPPAGKTILTIMGMEVVEVKEDDHISVGFTMK